MVFAGLVFLYCFLPPLLGCYFLVPDKLKNHVLLAASLLFYFYGEPAYFLLLFLSLASGYLHGLVIDRYRGRSIARPVFISSLCVSLGLLCYYKYAGFFLASFHALRGTGPAPLRQMQPLGISFYTFQIVSYTIDVYYGRVAAQKSFLKFALYVSMFPQLVAGPIVRYTDVAAALDRRTGSAAEIACGVRRFIVGLGKKVLLANTLGELCKAATPSGAGTVAAYWLAAIGFTLQIYFDFSGYSDMAIGLGRIFGFHFPENFLYPYISRSITEFWRRWHISLSSWFRDYVYIPLGGSRVAAGRLMLNLTIVWFLTGFWHGAGWNFIAWGLYFALLLVVEKFYLLNRLEKLPAFVRHLYVLFFVVLGFVLFNAAGLSDGLDRIAAMFGLAGIPLTDVQTLYNAGSYAVVLLIAACGATPLPAMAAAALKKSRGGRLCLTIAEPLCLLLILLAVTAYLVDGSFNPFLYFRF
ncbi:MAG: MBOAT family protein [Firmicutes bacterium]|nr:MBOAT family protein [Bacillota bacterium]HHX74726.1 MBOAT family protein [Bacillota bacterium]